MSEPISALNINIGKPNIPLLIREDIEYRLERLLSNKENKNFFKKKAEYISIESRNVRYNSHSIKLGNQYSLQTLMSKYGIDTDVDYITQYKISIYTFVENDRNINYEKTAKDMQELVEPFIKEYIIRYSPNKVYKCLNKLNYILLYKDFVIYMVYSINLLRGMSFSVYYVPFHAKFNANHLKYCSHIDDTDVWREGVLSDDDIKYSISYMMTHQEKQNDTSSIGIQSLNADNMQIILNSLLKDGLSFNKIASYINQIAKQYLESNPVSASVSKSTSTRSRSMR